MDKLLDIILVTFNNYPELDETVYQLGRLGFLGSRGVNVFVIDSSDHAIREKNSLLARSVGATYKWIEPTGIYPAMNKGIDFSSGDWVWFLNPGDLPMCESSQAIEILAERNNNLCNAVIFKTHTIDECGNFIRSRNLNIPKRRMLPTRFDFCHQGILYARSVFDSGVRFDTRFRLISDKILNDKIISIDSPIYDLQLAAFVFGGRSSAKWAVRKELVKYICLYLVRRL